MLATLDYIFNKVLPKKFIVWFIFFICFIVGRVSADQFTNITLGYISANLLSKWSPYIKQKIDDFKKKPSVIGSKKD